MYEDCFFRNEQITGQWLSKTLQEFKRTRPFIGCPRPTYYYDMSDNIYMIAESEAQVVEDIHLLLNSYSAPIQEHIYKIAPFYKPDATNLWHSAIDYGGDRSLLPFVPQNGWMEAYHTVFATGGCARMAFTGMGTSLTCINDQARFRLYEGAALELKRKEDNNPQLQHVDFHMSSMRALNCSDDEELPALAEFISVIENCSISQVAGVRCYSLLLWSGPAESPASFPWTLHIPHHFVEEGYVPRVGDSVNGLAIMYGTFLDQKPLAKPTVYHPLFRGKQTYTREEIEAVPADEGTSEESNTPQATVSTSQEAVSTTKAFEYLPRSLEHYPEAPHPKHQLDAKSLTVLPKYVPYHEYRLLLGDTESLQQIKNISRAKLTTLVKEVDVHLSRNFSPALSPYLKHAGIRHTAYNPQTNEQHIWITLPNPRGSETPLTNLLIAATPDNSVTRYTLLNTVPDQTPKKRISTLCLDNEKSSSRPLTLRVLLNQLPKIKEDGFFILTGFNQNDFLQARREENNKGTTFQVEWQIYDITWQFNKKGISEKRLAELITLYWNKGLLAIEGEEPWQWIPLVQQRKDKEDKRERGD
jgi:hypothetical protein